LLQFTEPAGLPAFCAVSGAIFAHEPNDSEKHYLYYVTCRHSQTVLNTGQTDYEYINKIIPNGIPVSPLRTNHQEFSGDFYFARFVMR
jgi:hypothetical protein